MKTKIILSFILVILFSAQTSVGFAQTATTTTSSFLTLDAPVTASSSAGSVLGVTIPQLITEINQAKIELSGITLSHTLVPIYKNVKNKKTKKITKTLTGYSLTKKDIALAILDPSSGAIFTTVGTQTGKKMFFNSPAVAVSLTTFNGVNSQFSVTQPAGGIVLALKYLIDGPETGSKADIENALQEAIYTPYSIALDQPEMVAYGANYLSTVINNAANQLQSQASSAIPGETITQAIPPAMIKALIYAEHTGSISNADPGHAFDALNVIFAANQNDAYKYSVSNDGYFSRGIAQFIPSTYQSLVQRHPEANLNPNFVDGMSDHANSVKAMYLLLDDYAGDVRIKAQAQYTIGDVFDYGAASYNGGVSRVANAVNQFGSSWKDDHSGDISTLQNQVNSLTAQAKSLKSKIKKAASKKAKAPLQSQLTDVNSQLSLATTQLSALQSASLRQETINYLNKIYSVIRMFNDQEA